MKSKKKHIILIAVLLVASIAVIYGLTYAKYISNSVWNYYLKSKGFYFSSEQLSSSTVVQNADSQWDGGSVNFSINNSLNQKVITDYDINYTASCTVTGDAAAYAECRMNGTSSNSQDGVLTSLQACSNTTGDQVDVSTFNKTNCELGGYEWINQIVTKNLYFDVILTDTNYTLNDVVVNVTVTSTSPYSSTLSGDFKLHKADEKGNDVTLSYKNYSNYDRLIVSNPSLTAKCVKVSWDASKLIINADSSQYSSANTDTNNYINEIKFNINAKDSLSYIFYSKSFSTTYNVSEFTLAETDGC